MDLYYENTDVCVLFLDLSQTAQLFNIAFAKMGWWRLTTCTDRINNWMNSNGRFFGN